MNLIEALSTKVVLLKNFIKQYDFKNLYQQNFSLLRNTISELATKCKDLALTNFELGKYHYLRGNKSDAILRFKMAKFFNPNYVASDYYIGRCYLESFKYFQAKIHLDKYLKSNHQEFIEEAIYCLNILNNQPSKITSIPKNIIKEKFDILAQLQEKTIIQQKDISAQQTLFTNILQALIDINKPFGNTILDLGCGLGMIGKLCRGQKIASSIIGVDISSMTAKQASSLSVEDMKAYNEVINEDYEIYLKNIINSEAKFDIIIASDFITYNTNLDFLFQNTHLLSKDTGLLCFTFKTSPNQEVEFKALLEQFYFSAEYVKNVANKYSWKLLREESFVFPSKEQGIAIILKK